MTAAIVLSLLVGTAPPESAAAVDALAAALAAPGPLADLVDKPFAKVPLTKADAARARTLVWDAHVARMKADRATELTAGKLTDGPHAMAFFAKTFGEKPAAGHSLWLSLHGGGNSGKRVNDQQWANQKRLYTLAEGVYVAPRAPTDTWNLWHEGHIDRLFARLIEDYVAVEGVDPNRVYVLGYSAGGDGVYQLAPRLADRWAAAGMMAGHPNDASPLNLRNVPFALHVGGEDAAYKRNTIAGEWGKKLDELRAADAGGYEHSVQVHDGKGHWMDREDAVALPWMAKHTRNPVPDRVVWRQSGTTHSRSYWLAVPAGAAKAGATLTAVRAGQTVTVTAEGLATLVVRLDDRMQDLDRPVTVTLNGVAAFTGVPVRTAGTLLRTLADRGDPKLMFDAEVLVAAGK